MGFFDLNIPYCESDRHCTDQSSVKRLRLRLTLIAMELGYTGIAYNRTHKGVLAESDRCSITLFPLSKLIPSSSSYFTTVEFHRRLLNIPVSSPFRQYTRLTVVIDTPSQASALNSGNPILRSYDIVAVRPMNQNSLDQACKTAEVDIIAINFAEKLQFRLKQPMVKAAIQRGLHFEVTYSGLLIDAQSRRQLISNCKLLVDWTRGKNLIFSSAAPSATEFRGPQDVTNLLTLLGLSVERAKAAISQNCRSLISNALRKKHFHKEAVKIEERPLDGLGETELSTSGDWLKWDPISSGDGDILLDDMKKSFSTLNTKSKIPKAIDFSSAMNDLPAYGLQIKDLIPVNKTPREPPDIGVIASQSMEIDGAVAVFERPDGEDILLKTQSGVDNLSKEQGKVGFLPGVLTFSHGATSESQASYCQDSESSAFALLPSAEECQRDLNIRYEATGFEDSTFLSSCSLVNSEGPISNEDERLNSPNAVEVNLVKGSQLHDTQSQGGRADVLPEPDCGQVHIITVDCEDIPNPDNHVATKLSIPLNDSSLTITHFEESNVEKRCDLIISAPDGGMTNKSENEKVSSLLSIDSSPQDAPMAAEQHRETTDISVGLNDDLPIAELLYKTISKNVLDEPNHTHTISRHHDVGKYLSGRERRKQNRPHRPLMFRFKPLLNPRPFKRKARK